MGLLDIRDGGSPEAHGVGNGYATADRDRVARLGSLHGLGEGRVAHVRDNATRACAWAVGGCGGDTCGASQTRGIM